MSRDLGPYDTPPVAPKRSMTHTLPVQRLTRMRTAALAAIAALLATSAPGLAPSRSGGPQVEVLVREVVAASNAAEQAVVAVGGAVTRELPIVDGFAARVPERAVGLLSS